MTYNIPGSGEQFDTIAWRSSSGNNDNARPVGQENTPQSPVATSMEEQQISKGDYATGATTRVRVALCVLLCLRHCDTSHTHRKSEREKEHGCMQPRSLRRDRDGL